MKHIFASKTIWFSILTAAGGIVNHVAPFIPPQYTSAALVGIAAITAALRVVTTKAVGVAP